MLDGIMDDDNLTYVGWEVVNAFWRNMLSLTLVAAFISANNKASD